MSQLWTDLDNPSLADDYVSPTSDVLLGEFQESQGESYITWRARDFAGWPVLMTENVTALKDADLLESAVPEERNAREPKTILVTFPSKHGQSFTYIVVTSPRPPYVPIEDRFGSSPYQTGFSPDFSNIKKFVAHVIGHPPASLPKKELPFKIKQPIPTTVSPQVIIEGEEKNLTKDLETAVRIAKESYSTLKAIDINIEHDPEIPDRKTIRFTLTVSGEPELVLKDEFKFKDKLYSALDIKTCEQITTTYKWKS